MKRIVATGSECTGKTTLIRDLAASLGEPSGSEYVRRFVEEQGRAPELGDVEAIARGQLALEEETRLEARDFLLLDTDLLSTWVYSRHYYGVCPGWIGSAIETCRADLYLLAGIDVPWAAEGDQRDRDDRRGEMQELFRAELMARDLEFVEIAGGRRERLARALELIARF